MSGEPRIIWASSSASDSGVVAASETNISIGTSIADACITEGDAVRLAWAIINHFAEVDARRLAEENDEDAEQIR